MCENMQEVSSSNIASVGYDENIQTVCVRFLNGSLYVYRGVSIMEFEGLRDASSVGGYLNRNIKNVYPYERIE